jgi:hypothetical protein
MSLSSDVRFLLELQSQLRVLHWQTKSHAKHLALGDAYETLGGLIDTYVETCMGIHGRFILGDEERSLSIQNLSDIDMLGMIKTVRISFQEMDINPKDVDLLSIRDEMLVIINILSYLLTLRYFKY